MNELNNNNNFEFKGYIYKITNINNNKCYIGKVTSTNPEKYILNHFRKAIKDVNNKKYLYRSIRKYGIYSFKWIILGELTASTKIELKSKLNEAEIECIYFFRSFGSDGKNKDSIYGYNTTIGGDGGNTIGNHPNIKEIGKKISESNKGKILGRKYDTSQKNYIGEKVREAYILKPELREKRSQAQKIKWEDLEYRENQINSFKRSARTLEARERNKERNILKWSDLEYREKMSSIFKERCKNLEIKEDLKKRLLKNRDNFKGKNNPMYGKSVYNIWIEKYGIEEADRRKEECRIKKSNSLKENAKNNPNFGTKGKKINRGVKA